LSSWRAGSDTLFPVHADQGMRLRPQLWLLLSVLVAFVAWLYMSRVLLPWEHYFNVEAGTMKAALGDLYSPWLGTRDLLQRRMNPYGPEVTHEIQGAFYGHDIEPQSATGSRITDEQRFAYPVYVVFLLAPTSGIEFETVHAWAPFVLMGAVGVSVGLWVSFLRWRVSAITAMAIILFVLASPQIAQGLRLRQIGLLVAAMIALAAWLVRRNWLLAAGALLAFSTIKPQMSILPIAWFLLWSAGDFSRRWRLPASFCGTLALQIGAGEFVLPGWPRDFVAGLAAYRRYGPMTTLLQLTLGRSLGVIVAAAAVVGLLAWGWVNRKHAADSPEFARTLAMFFVVAAFALPLMPPFNQVLLILPALMIMRDWSRLPQWARIALIVCISWPWAASLAMVAFSPSTRSLSQLPLLPSGLVLFFPLLLFVSLMARRSSVSFLEPAARRA